MSGMAVCICTDFGNFSMIFCFSSVHFVYVIKVCFCKIKVHTDTPCYKN